MYCMLLLILIAAIVVPLWGAVFVLRGSLLVGCAIYLVCASCFSGTFFSFDAAGLTWSIDRFVLLGLVLMLLVHAWLGKLDPKPICRSEWLLAAFYALLLASTFLHDWRSAGSGDSSIIMHLVNGYLVPLVIYVVARQAKTHQRSLHVCRTGRLWPVSGRNGAAGDQRPLVARFSPLHC